MNSPYRVTKSRGARTSSTVMTRCGSESSATSSNAQRPHRRNRTINSCHECRQRKMKCDQRKPSCSSCARRGVECKYYRTDAEAQKQLAEAKDNATEIFGRLTHKVEVRKHRSAAADAPYMRPTADMNQRYGYNYQNFERPRPFAIDATDCYGQEVQEAPPLTYDNRSPTASPGPHASNRHGSPYAYSESIHDNGLTGYSPPSIYQAPTSYHASPAYDPQLMGGQLANEQQCAHRSSAYSLNHHYLPFGGGMGESPFTAEAFDLQTMYQSSPPCEVVENTSAFPAYPRTIVNSTTSQPVPQAVSIPDWKLNPEWPVPGQAYNDPWACY